MGGKVWLGRASSAFRWEMSQLCLASILTMTMGSMGDAVDMRAVMELSGETYWYRNEMPIRSSSERSEDPGGG